jgi:hypothetical protein
MALSEIVRKMYSVLHFFSYNRYRFSYAYTIKDFIGGGQG